MTNDMHPNAATIERFYAAFARRDASAMTACYAADARFTDPVFDLAGPQIGAMWSMLCERGKDLTLEWRDVRANDANGSAHWEPRYTFSATGRLVHKAPNNQPESGIWVCTPGRWRLSIPRDEVCHFVAGRATYRRDDGEEIAIEPGTVVLFPAGWTGECTVHETMRNVYMLA